MLRTRPITGRHSFTLIELPAARERGFTLIELMVVVAIIMVLLTLVGPAMVRAMDTSRIATCQSGQRQMITGYLAYSQDNLGALVYGYPDDNRSDAFVKRGAGYDAIRNGALFKYIPEIEAWRCTADVNGNERSYVPVASLNGEVWNDIEQHHGYRVSQILNTASQIVWVEESDPRGWNMGSWMMYVDDPHHWRWIDNVGRFHQNGTADNYAFADGHVEHWEWEDDNTLAASRNGQNFMYDPNNPDWLRLRKSYRVMAPKGQVRFIQ